MNRNQAKAIIATVVANDDAEKVLLALESAGMSFAEYGDADINQVVTCFKTLFGTTKATRYDRYAAARLTKRHGVANIVLVITALAERSGERFSPTVSSISQLEDKWVSVIKFLRASHTPVQELE